MVPSPTLLPMENVTNPANASATSLQHNSPIQSRISRPSHGRDGFQLVGLPWLHQMGGEPVRQL